MGVTAHRLCLLHLRGFSGWRNKFTPKYFSFAYRLICRRSALIIPRLV
ncbi:hypothetical protein EG68_00803 [Paragonimus skrjabini miyazakii]|uniref:Uncharacterized protein n=1 Tax=Paragonimus skrjabini miyazakii TaxID=59628 RepID=A0A8S9Z9P5_9TREM|nr:hypothetical protein EG68_00803 [Paragonimus skrjabini miyazakii]